MSAIRRIEVRVGDLVFDADASGDERDPLVLLLHGFPQTSHAWRTELPALSDAGCFALAPDQRGISPRARPTEMLSYRTELLLDDALAIADAFGQERFHLVGHDWGGQLAWLLAAQKPARVRSLTVLSRPHPAAFAAAMAGDAEQPKRSGHHRAFQREDAANGLLADRALRLRSVLSEQGVGEADIEAYLSRLGSRAALDAAIHWYRAAVRSDPALLGRNVPEVSVPTLYVWGDADATVGRPAAEGTAGFVTGPYDFVELPGVGHFVTDQAPGRVTDALLAHIRQNS